MSSRGRTLSIVFAIVLLLPALPRAGMAASPPPPPLSPPSYLYIYRAPDYSLLSAYDLQSSMSAVQSAARLAYLNRYAERFYAALDLIGGTARTQRVTISPEVLYHSRFDWHIDGVRDVLPYTTPLVFARWLYQHGYSVIIEVLGNIDSSTIDPPHESQPFGYNRPLSTRGVASIAREMRHIVGAVTDGDYSSDHVALIYENEPDLFDLQAGRHIISAAEYYSNLRDLRAAARAQGLQVPIRGAALSDGWDDPLVRGTNRMRQWIDAARQAGEREISLNLYAPDTAALARKFVPLRSYAGPNTQLRVHELGMLYSDPSLRGQTYKSIETRRAEELPLMADYLRQYVTGVSVYTQPYRAYGSRGAAIMSALQIPAGWTGTAWEIFDSPLQYRWTSAASVTIYNRVAARPN